MSVQAGFEYLYGRRPHSFSGQPVPALRQCVAFGRSTPAAAIWFPFPVTHRSPVCTPTVPASPLPSRAQDSTGPPGVRITAPVAPGTVPRYARAGSAQRRRLVGATTPEPPSSQPACRARTRQGRGSSRLLTSRRVQIARNNKTYRLYRAARVRSGVISRRSARRRGPAARRSPANGDFRGRSVPPGTAPPRRTFPAAPARPPPPLSAAGRRGAAGGRCVPVAVRLLHPASRGRALAGRLGGQLLAGRLAAGGLAGGLLGTGHAAADVAALHLPRQAARLTPRPGRAAPPPVPALPRRPTRSRGAGGAAPPARSAQRSR